MNEKVKQLKPIANVDLPNSNGARIAAFKAPFNSKTSKFLKSLYMPNKYNICNGKISKVFLTDARKSAKLAFVVYKEQPVSFAFVQKKPRKTFYVDLNCSKKGYGSSTMKALEQFAKLNKMHIMEVSALKPVMGFYKKLGYLETDEPCVTDPYVLLVGFHQKVTG